MENFPTMVYKSPGPHNAGHGRTFDFKGIKNSDELAKALKDGWYETKEEALKDKKTELLAKANERGLKVDKRLSEEKIEKMIEDHDEAKRASEQSSLFRGN